MSVRMHTSHIGRAPLPAVESLYCARIGTRARIMVLPIGEIAVANDNKQYSDLLWGLRGGG